MNDDDPIREAICTVFELCLWLTILAMVVAGCTDREPCRVVPQLDTTGNTIHCACSCELQPEVVCPLVADASRSKVPACWDAEGSSSDG